MIFMIILLIPGKNLHLKVFLYLSQEPQPYKPYGHIPSSYQTSYPGHKPQLR